MPLFSGLSCFTVGTDDTLRNMRWRLDPLMEKGPVGLILKTVFDRLQVEDTAYARLRALHHRERTGWWTRWNSHCRPDDGEPGRCDHGPGRERRQASTKRTRRVIEQVNS